MNSFVRFFVENIPDRIFLKMYYRRIFGKKLNLMNPKTFNEKLQWLKLYDRKEIYTQMADKIAARTFVEERIGSKYLIPLIATWDKPEDIQFDMLPDTFVMKCNHNSGLGMYICKNKKEMVEEDVLNNLRIGLSQNHYKLYREWPYKNIQRRIICEKYLKSESGSLDDYKIHCFNGRPRFILVCNERFSETGVKEDFYSTDWVRYNLKRPGICNTENGITKPEKLDEMLMLAEILAKDTTFLRVDFYIYNGEIYFGELTFFPTGGFVAFEPEIFDTKFGDMLQLPLKKKGKECK